MKFAWVFLLVLVACPTNAAIIADHVAVTQFDNIPSSAYRDIRDNYQILYGHTSHGSQVVSGAPPRTAPIAAHAPTVIVLTVIKRAKRFGG